jgi:hypothetical protein
MTFERAVKGKKPVRVVIGGVSGAGKTYTALTFAEYLSGVTGKPTAAIDTEHYRMSLYADKFNFDVNNWEPPFDPRQLIKTIHEAEKSQYGQLIVDSSTHFYSGENGLLEIVSDAAKTKYGGNIYAGWAVGTPIQNDLIDAIIRSPLHMIFCTRAKQGYAETEKNNRKTYEKVGMELQQRDGFEFDFDFSLMMDMDNNAMVAKGMGFVPTGMYLKKPDAKAIELIMRSINENTIDAPAIPLESKATQFKKKEEAVESLKTSVIELAKTLGGSKNEALMKLIKEFEPSGNPNKIKDETMLIDLLGKMNEIKSNVTTKDQ